LDKLKNRLVLVDPDLANDPARKQGQFGRILGRMEEVHLVFVAFPGGKEAGYDTGDLLVLMPHKLLEGMVFKRSHPMLRSDRRRIGKIARLAKSGRAAHIREAMELAMASAMLRKLAVVTLREWIDMGLHDYADKVTGGE